MSFQPPGGPTYPAAIGGLEDDVTVTVVDRNSPLTDFDVDLAPGRVSGTLSDEGTALAGAAVRLTRRSPLPTFDVLVAATGDGAFAFDHLPDGDYEISARPDGRPTFVVVGHATIVDGADESLPLEYPDGSIEGTIFQDGLPVDTGIGEVTLTPRDAGPERTTPVAVDGSFRFDNVLDGDYVVSTFDTANNQRRWHPSSTTAAGATTVSVTDQGALDDVDIVLHPTVGAITGSVTTPDGSALGGVTVEVFSGLDNDTPTSTTTTGIDGTFRVERVRTRHPSSAIRRCERCAARRMVAHDRRCVHRRQGRAGERHRGRRHPGHRRHARIRVHARSRHR